VNRCDGERALVFIEIDLSKNYQGCMFKLYVLFVSIDVMFMSKNLRVYYLFGSMILCIREPHDFIFLLMHFSCFLIIFVNKNYTSLQILVIHKIF